MEGGTGGKEVQGGGDGGREMQWEWGAEGCGSARGGGERGAGGSRSEDASGKDVSPVSDCLMLG